MAQVGAWAVVREAGAMTAALVVASVAVAEWAVAVAEWAVVVAEWAVVRAAGEMTAALAVASVAAEEMTVGPAAAPAEDRRTRASTATTRGRPTRRAWRPTLRPTSRG